MNVVMLLYNDLKHDGRAERAARALETLGAVHMVDRTQVACDASTEYSKYIGCFLPAAVEEYVKFLWSTTKKVLAEDVDVVYAHDYYCALPVVLAKMVPERIVVYDAHELMVKRSVHAYSPRDYVFYLFQRIAVRVADVVVTTSNARAQVIGAHHKLAKVPVTVRNIPNTRRMSRKCVVWTRDPIVKWLRKLKESGRTLVVYQGTMSRERRLDRFIRACLLLPKKYSLILIGDGPDTEEIRSQYRSSAIHHVPSVDRARLYPILRTCDIGVLSYGTSDLNEILCSPNKIYEYAICGLPMIASGQEYIRTRFDEWGIGLWVEDDHETEVIARKIQIIEENIETMARACLEFSREEIWAQEEAKLIARIRSRLSGG